MAAGVKEFQLRRPRPPAPRAAPTRASSRAASCPLDRKQPLGRIGVLGHVRPRIVLEAGGVAEVERGLAVDGLPGSFDIP